jgi:hypothetical protein
MPVHYRPTYTGGRVTFLQCLPWIFLSVASMIQTLYIRKLSERFSELEHTIRMKEWLDALHNGEHPADLAREMGRPFEL